VSGTVTMDPGIGYVIVFAMAALLLSAAGAKWRAVAEFRAVVANYRVLPPPLTGAAAIALPALETLVAVLLLVAPARRGAALGGAVLLLLYAGAISVNLWRGRRDLDCGCAGPARRRPIAAWMVWRNVVLAAVLVAAGLRWDTRTPTWTDALTIVAGVTALAILYAALDRLLGDVVPRAAALRGMR